MPRNKIAEKVKNVQVSISIKNGRRWVSLKNHLGFPTDDELFDYLLNLADSVIETNNLHQDAELRKEEECIQKNHVQSKKMSHNNSHRRSTRKSNVDDGNSMKAPSFPGSTRTKRHVNKSKCHRDKHKKKQEKIIDPKTTAKNKSIQKIKRENQFFKESNRNDPQLEPSKINSRKSRELLESPEINQTLELELAENTQKESNQVEASGQTCFISDEEKIESSTQRFHVSLQDEMTSQTEALEYIVQDSISLTNWINKYKDKNSRVAKAIDSTDPMSHGYGTDLIFQDNPESVKECDIQCEEKQVKVHPNWPLYSRESLPYCLELKMANMDHGLGVFTKSPLPMHTQFGPLVGQFVQEKDIPENHSMKHIWEISENDKTQQYMSTTNPLSSNWIRYMRPSEAEDSKNVNIVKKNGQLFAITCKTLAAGTELMYWLDSSWARKNKMDKSNCGGCNLKFSHPIYYRLHCCIFHDTNYSLTIRKYHCKVCGAAILGKDNIMKHAAQFHAGRGAYQCQYCKKFFLRLNYLEMHRTYGCSKNPARSRPLCDFCGRKFCQPQKLKVHIKRMHSDTSEILEEFQCKQCSKLLGSRAALQRHMKEVHHKDVVGAAACDRCGKTFQNKSNLKIHMLTHSGVKPFKCQENECKAAFTTKQCLQFHYKKVHGLSDEKMPKIERSIAYTFDAYSGGQEEKSSELEDDDNDDDDDHDQKATDSDTCEQQCTREEDKLDVYESTWITASPGNVIDIPSNVQESDNEADKQEKLSLCKRQESYNASLLVEAALDAAERDIGVVTIPSLQDNEQAANADYHESPTNRNVDLLDEQALPMNAQYRSGYLAGTPSRLHEQYLEQDILTTPRYDQVNAFHSNANFQMPVSSDSSDSAVQNLSLSVKDRNIQQMDGPKFDYEADYNSASRARMKFEPLLVQSAKEEGLDMSARGFQAEDFHLHHYHHHHHHHHNPYKIHENERHGVDLSTSAPCVSPSYATIYPSYPRSHELHTAVSRIIASPLPETLPTSLSSDAQIHVPRSSYSTTSGYHNDSRSGYHYYY